MAVIAVTAILGKKYYPHQTFVEQDRDRPIAELTFADITSYVNRQLGMLAHALEGYGNQRYQKEYSGYTIVGKIDLIKNSDGKKRIVEAKYVFSTSKTALQYGLDQLDLYGWITGITEGELKVLWVNRGYSQTVSHSNNFVNAQALVDWYIGATCT